MNNLLKNDWKVLKVENDNREKRRRFSKKYREIEKIVWK